MFSSDLHQRVFVILSEAINNVAKKFGALALPMGAIKGLLQTQIKTRSEEELRNDIEAAINMFNKCLEDKEVFSNATVDAGHNTEDR